MTLGRLDPDDLHRFIGAILGLWGSGYIPDRVKVSALTCLIPVLPYLDYEPGFDMRDELREQLADSDAGVRAVAEQILTMWQRDRDAAQAALAAADERVAEAERRATIAEEAWTEADARAEEAGLHAAAVENETAETERRAVDRTEAALAAADARVAEAGRRAT